MGRQYNIWGSGSSWFKVTSDVASITRIEMECRPYQGSTSSSAKAATVCEWNGVDFDGSGNDFTNMSTDGAIAIWEGTATTTILITSNDDVDICNLVVYYEPLPSVEYSFTVTSDHALPTDFTPSVMVEGDPISGENTYSTPKSLTASNISATTPDGWYYEVTVDGEREHAFVVTYKEYLHYHVTVTGCTDNDAGVQYHSTNYRNGNRIDVKTELVVNDLEVLHVNGYVEQTPFVSELDGYNATLTIPYTDAELKDYSVTISGMPAGASVMIEEETFTENGTFTHQSRKDLDRYFVNIQDCPDTHFTNDNYEWYNDGAFTITFTPYFVYSVAVADASAYKGVDAGVKVNYSDIYHSGETIKSKTALTESNVKAIEIDGYTGIVTLSGDVFTVSYAKNEFITFDAYKFSVGDWGTGSLDKTIDDVRLQAWDSGDYFAVNGQYDSNIDLTSSGAPIEKVEIEYISWGKPSSPYYSGVDSYNQGNGISTIDDITTWTGSTRNLKLWCSNGTANVSLIKVWLAQPTTYHVNITGMPESEEYFVVVNYDYENGKFTTNGEYTYTSYSELNENNVYCNYAYPQTYKVTKSYDAESKTINVVYTALTQYNVVADAENTYTEYGSGVRVKYGENDWRNKGIGDTFYFDGTLEESAVVIRTVDGYTGTFVLDNEAEPKTITVKYVENTPVTYTVVFAGDIPEGASVTITDAAGDYTVNYADAEKTFQSKYTITEASAKVKAFEFYDATVTLDGANITVTYSEVDYIYVDLTKATGSNHTRTSAEGTITVKFTAYNNCANLYTGWPIVVTSNTYNIKKIEYVIDEIYGNAKRGTTFNWGSWTTDYEVWEAIFNNNPVRVKSVELTTGNSDICYTAVKVYLDTDPVGEFAMSAAGWATLFVDTEYTLPEGYTAYTAGKVVDGQATLMEDGQIVLTEIERIPAYTAVLISGPENDHVGLLATYGAVAPEVNYLQGTLESQTFYATNYSLMGPGHYDSKEMEWVYGTFGPCQLYQLAKNNGEVGFYRQDENGASLSCGAKKAFLVVPNPVAANNARLVLPGQGDATGINAINAENNDAIYNLQGQRVNAAKAGVYVKNGKKYIVK